MKVREILAKAKLDKDYTGYADADDTIFAIDFSEEQNAEISEYFVALKGMTNVSSKINRETEEKAYLDGEKRTLSKSLNKEYTMAGDRYIGDEFQDKMLDSGMKYGFGNAIDRKYVEIDTLTGKCEQGTVTIIIEDDRTGEVGTSAGFSAKGLTKGVPECSMYEAPKVP